MSDINQMAHLAMTQMWNMDPYVQYGDEKPPVVFPHAWAAIQQAASMANRTVTPPQRRKANPVPKEHKDDAYFERRKKNNDSAKRSRENRRQKEAEYQMRAEFLQNENIRLNKVIQQLQQQINQLRTMLQSPWPINP